MAFSLPAIGIYVAAASAIASGVQGYQGQVAGKNARQGQREAQGQAQASALAAARKADQLENKANPKQPDALALLGKEQLSSLQGIGSSSLTGPDAITPRIKLGSKALLGS